VTQEGIIIEYTKES